VKTSESTVTAEGSVLETLAVVVVVIII